MATNGGPGSAGFGGGGGPGNWRRDRAPLTERERKENVREEQLWEAREFWKGIGKGIVNVIGFFIILSLIFIGLNGGGVIFLGLAVVIIIVVCLRSDVG